MPRPELYTDELLARAAKIRLLLMDCDGVLTDGRIYFLPDGQGGRGVAETKPFDCHDGMALKWARTNEIETGIISGRGGLAVQERARSSGMKYLFEGNTEKLPLLDNVLEQSGLSVDQVAYIGDDVTDLPLLTRVGFSAAPTNSRPEVLNRVHFQIPAAGGSGAVREVIELLLVAQGKWDAIMAHYDV